MNIIYNLFVNLFGFAVSIASRFNPKAKLWLDGRKDWELKMKSVISAEDRVIWIHCSSLGEFEQGRPVMEKLKSDYPHHKLAVSFFSPSGYEVRKDFNGADYIFYLPLDSIKNAKKLIQTLHPELLILVKYEYWYNLLNELNHAEIPVVVISAVIKEKELFFRSWASWFRKIISGIDQFFVQDKDSENLLNSIGIDHVTVSGDTRFDRVKEIYESHSKLEFVEKFKVNSNLIVAGSTWAEDEVILADYINQDLPEDWKVIFAPHNIDEKQIQNLMGKLNGKSVRYSEMTDEKLVESQFLILDTIGILTQVYAYSTISYVGGGFTKTGVHNTLEPAVFGVPLIFGPNYKSYMEAVHLVDRKAAVRFKDGFDFEEKMNELIQDSEARKERGKSAFDYIQQKPNSTQLIMNYVKKVIK
ncbi:MAG: glycosyltransferase N-terminal domain-containing protein [Weeksellaceae bacterium]